MGSKPQVYVPGLRKGKLYYPADEAMMTVLHDLATHSGNLERAAELLAAIDETFMPAAENVAHLGQRIGAVLNQTSINQARSEIAELDHNQRVQNAYPYDRYLTELPGYGRETSRIYLNPEFGKFNRQPGDWVANVDARVVDMAVVATLASMVADDNWQLAIPGTDSGISSAWKFQRPKELQTPGDGLFNQYPIVGLISTNGSGKTFATERDFGTRIARQTLGHIPAGAPNSFTPHTSFNMLGRYNAFERGDHGELVNELRRWQQALRYMGDHPVFYLDEAMSTASPFGQAALNLAFARYIQENGGLVSLATHNEHVANTLREWEDAGLYTFTHDADSPYQMVEGMADSGFVDVVRSRGLGERYASLMEAYLNGSLSVGYAPNYPAVPNGYSQAEREAMMEGDDGLAYMFPETLHSPAYVPLSEDGKLLSGPSLEQVQLLYYSDPIEFTELIERQRTIKELAGYEELDTWISDLALLKADLEPYLELIDGQSPSVLLQQLNPIRRANERFDSDEEEFILGDSQLTAKVAAYVELLELLHFGEDFTDLRRSLSELSSQIGELQQAHQRALQSADNQGFYERSVRDREYKDGVEKISGQAAKLVSTAIDGIDFEHSDLEKFWLDDNIRPIIEVLARPSMTYDNQQHDYATQDKQRNQQRLKRSLLIVVGGASEGLAKLMLAEPTIMDAVSRLSQHSGQIDSVHIRQGASHLQRLIANQAPAPNQAANSSSSVDAWKSKFSPLTNRRSQELYNLTRSMEQRSETAKAIDRLLYLSDLAKRVSAGEYALADFNTTGEIRIESVKSILDDNKHQPFDYGIHGSWAGVALSGEHSAGKTYSTKHVANAVLLAMKTGIVPASYGSMPYFERISYISRIAQEMDADASAGQQEVDVWADHDRILASAKTAITFADEVGSSTSPKYQAALAAAAMTVNAARGHRLVVTTHHDGFLDFVERSSSLGIQGIVRDQGGKRVIYKTKVISNPIPFAKDIGLPARLTELAEAYYEQLTGAPTAMGEYSQ